MQSPNIDKFTVSAIVAADLNNGIGYKNQLPWDLPEDMAYFRRVTDGKPVIVGRKTMESIGRPLSNRDVVLITRQRDYDASRFEVSGLSHTPWLAMIEAQEIAYRKGLREAIIIGGEEIYRALADGINRVYMTRVVGTYETDASFPIELAEPFWERSAYIPATHSSGIEYAFEIWDRTERLTPFPHSIEQ